MLLIYYAFVAKEPKDQLLQVSNLQQVIGYDYV